MKTCALLHRPLLLLRDDVMATGVVPDRRRRGPAEAKEAAEQATDTGGKGKRDRRPAVTMDGTAARVGARDGQATGESGHSTTGAGISEASFLLCTFARTHSFYVTSIWDASR